MKSLLVVENNGANYLPTNKEVDKGIKKRLVNFWQVTKNLPLNHLCLQKTISQGF